MLWIDKSKFEVFGSQRRTFLRCRKKEKMLEEGLLPFVKHGGGNVKVWGCCGGGKVGDLNRGKRDLEEGLSLHFATPCGRRLIGDNFLLQQDNDPKHSSKLCNNYLRKRSLLVFCL